MGWTATYKPKGEKLLDFFVRTGVLTWSSPDWPYTAKVLDSAFVNCSEFYAAVEFTHKLTGERKVWAAVIMVKLFKEDKDGYNICYKELTETMGIGQHTCPKRILDLLTPTDDENANEWRAENRARIAKREEKPALVPGTRVLADPPVLFRDGSEKASLIVRERRGNQVNFVGGYRLSLQYINRGFANGRIKFVPASEVVSKAPFTFEAA